jgi:hypothetical protein
MYSPDEGTSRRDSDWSIYKLSESRRRGDLSKEAHIEQSYRHSNNNSESLLGVRVSTSSVLCCVFTYLSINIYFIHQPLEIVLWAYTLKRRLTSASAATLKKEASARLNDNCSLCVWRVKVPTPSQGYYKPHHCSRSTCLFSGDHFENYYIRTLRRSSFDRWSTYYAWECVQHPE